MALTLVRTTLSRKCQPLLEKITGNVSRSCVACRGSLGLGNAQHQVAFISSKHVREELQIKRPAPFPYKTKSYNFIRSILDPTPARFDDNTKIIVVDGNVAAGKTSFAKKLADELDMHYVCEPDLETRFITSSGYDLRKLDPELPEAAKSYDLKKFLSNPHHENAAAFQFDMFVIRFEYYLDSLCHILNTGEGIVMDRSVYSDIVFLESMCKFGYVSKNAKKVYYKLREATLVELLKPHLVIFLDVPAKTCLERIKRRALPHETETKVLNLEYLQSIEDVYKNIYLQQMSVHSEIMVFDWSEYGDVEVVVEDIERIDFDSYDKHDPKCKDWRITDLWDWNDLRTRYTCERDEIMALFNIADITAPELLLSAADCSALEEAKAKVPGIKFAEGYNVDTGDKWLIFKNKGKPREGVL